MNLANYITIARLIMIPGFLIFLSQEPPDMAGALIVFLAASLSDALDGIIARKTNTVSNVGKFLDPMADKLLLVSGFVALTILGKIPLWVTIVVFARDIILFVGWLGLAGIGKNIEISPSIYSKITTFLQMVTIILVLAKFTHIQYIYYFTVGFTALSGIHYMVNTVLFLSEPEPEND